ncbi:MAG: SOS response-associated peptidase [Lachnospiraceae bacterium]|nr:SOS response-associated peptidase [Lachnospiraceae bacterium]
MCGRYYVDDGTAREIEKVVRKVEAGLLFQKAGDVYPSQAAPVLTGRSGELTVELMNWGFPRYQSKGLLINARAETVLERKTFRESVLHRRCIIPAGHFYEWDAQKEKVQFQREDDPVLYMAGFYNRFQDMDRFMIITTQANASVAPVHERMPLVLEQSELEAWVYDDAFLSFALTKEPAQLRPYREFEQQSLFSRYLHL